MSLRSPEGTRDLLPDEAAFWLQFKARAFEMFARYGYVPIETPLIEQTELFVRGIGEATDVVSKEMFSALSGENLKKLLAGETLKAKSRLSLRPENTAGVVRAAIQHDLVAHTSAPVKLMYAGPMFRAERPQKGRQRQFNQVGIECLGAEEPSVDAEGIIMLMRFFEAIGIPSSCMTLLCNSMGCEHCRPAYREVLRSYLLAQKQDLCETCNTRIQSNPLRTFDCKNPACKEVMSQAPRITDFLCNECHAHDEAVRGYLSDVGLSYIEDATLVRGLDYYTRSVFEVAVNTGMGSQNAIGGGGRYDRLMEEMGGRPTPGFGFALGYERCLLALEAHGMHLQPAMRCEVFVACVNNDVGQAAFSLVQQLRDVGVSAELDHQGRSLKSQFKLADKLFAVYVIILGPDELAQDKVRLRDMQTHEEKLVLREQVVSFVERELQHTRIA